MSPLSTLPPNVPAPTPTLSFPPTSPSACPSSYPHGHNEHVCESRPRRRSSSASSIVSLPLRRRESFATSPASHAPYGNRLDTVVSGSSDVDLSMTTASSSDLEEKRQVTEVEDVASNPKSKFNFSAVKPPTTPNAARPRLPWQASKSKGGREANPDPESGGIKRTELEWNWSRWAGENIEPAALVPALVTQALSSGLLDATTYADFETFASNQTGNAILLTLSAVGTDKVEVQLALTAISFGGFIGFAFLFGHIGHWVGVRRRLWLLISVAIQTIMLILSAILLSPHGPRVTALGGAHSWVVLFLFAAMSGAQVAMARQSSCQELPTAPMTSTFVDFVADHYLFAAWGDPKATPRNRRIMYVIAMIGGSFIGAVLHKYAMSWVVVAVSVGVKTAVLVFVSVAVAEED